MRKWAKGTTQAALLTAGFVALGAGVPSLALADTTSGDGGLLSGNQIHLPISVPVDLSGNALGILGDATAGSHGGATVSPDGGGSGARTSGRNAIGSGNQVDAPVSAPVNVCGNAVGVLGGAEAHCKGGAKVKRGRGSGPETSGDGGVLSGNQVVAPVSVPVNVCGNAVAVLGSATASCAGGASVGGGDGHGDHRARRDHGGHSGPRTSSDGGVLSGNQVVAPVSVPINVCGNAIGGLLTTASCAGGASIGGGDGWGHGGHSGPRTSGDGGVLSGNQVVAPVSVPVNVCGNAVGVLGGAEAHCKGGAKVRRGGGSGPETSGDGGLLSGNQLVTPVSIPVNICGNGVAVLGQAQAACVGGASVTPPAPHSPGKPDQPGAPDQPGTPDQPGKPDQPGAPDQPGTPDQPGKPDQPGAPDQPGKPDQPGAPDQPGKPDQPGAPDQPGTPGKPDQPGTPDAPQAPPKAGTPGDTPATVAPASLHQTGASAAKLPFTGLNAGSLVALAVGMVAAGATSILAATRRLRIRRR